MAEDVSMPDADGGGGDSQYPASQPPVKLLVEEELNEKYPNRPRNHAKTLPFHDLFQTLFNPLNENKKKPTGPLVARKKQGPHGPSSLNPQEMRRAIIERFISRWRKEVGDDIFPAFRLILPEKDRERPMYGLKEKTLGKLLVRIIKIDKNSEDGYNLLNWKLPGQKSVSSMAGDFAGRCHEVLSKRSIRSKPGDMTIEEVNDGLDRLSVAGKESDQLPIMEEFYQRMNAEEMTWLTRIILKQMKIGATEKTILGIWHSDAETLFNISSNLRRVCWELYDSDVRLEGEETDITLMQCFQPQLAQFQEHHFDRLVRKMRPTEEDPVFWIEEKLDGERMQLHMIEDVDQPGGKRFAFWSRKAKDYTYLYGNGFEDENSALTRHLREAFHPNVRNIILDGEMITWDPETDFIVPFGTLKTAALSEQKNPFGTGQRPLYRVFDILYLNDKAITKYILHERRKALQDAIKPVHRRLELHFFTEARSAADIEPELRKVVATSSEGLVLKNPRSMYRLNERNDDWIKVKPEYMTEYGEELDCLVVGGYYGSGRRGGALSSFMCGLRVDTPQHTSDGGEKSKKFWSFFKVGGGFSASDYATLRHRTEGKWLDWDPKRPPTEYVELGGGVEKQYERPDVWIKPEDSLVISVKAASVAASPQFRMNITLRFPRFRALRLDKDWQTSLSVREFIELKDNAEKEHEKKQFVVDDARRQRRIGSRQAKKPLVLAGTATADDANRNGVPAFKDIEAPPVFEGLRFFIATDSSTPQKLSKPQLEGFVKKHGGQIVQEFKHKASEQGSDHLPMVIGERPVLKVLSIKKAKSASIIRPTWLFDCVDQARRDLQDGQSMPLLLPFEYERHVYFGRDEDAAMFGLTEDSATGDLVKSGAGTDEYGDSYARDVFDVKEMKKIFAGMTVIKKESGSSTKHGRKAKSDNVEEGQAAFRNELQERAELNLTALPGCLFTGCVVRFFHEAYPKARQDDQSIGNTLSNNNGPGSTHGPDLQVTLAQTVLQFAGGRMTADNNDMNTTHVVVSAHLSREDARDQVRLIRKELAERATSKLPRIVTSEWIQQSWAEKTLLNEERFAVT